MKSSHESMTNMHWPDEPIARSLIGMITYVPHTHRPFRLVSPGVEFAVLRAHEGEGRSLLVRMAKGAHARMHHHPGGEETFILSGKIQIGEHLLGPGDYLWTPPGVAHDGEALEETVFFVVLPAGLRVSG